MRQNALRPPPRPTLSLARHGLNTLRHDYTSDNIHCATSRAYACIQHMPQNEYMRIERHNRPNGGMERGSMFPKQSFFRVKGCNIFSLAFLFHGTIPSQKIPLAFIDM